ncbi:MAG: sporulation protein YunB [Clostridiales bacterium]|jgi:sporulation protein YunB|nr:sporulation protein YunB [Clostridiales bacterium]
MTRPYFAMGRRPRKKNRRGKRAIFVAFVVVALGVFLTMRLADNVILPAVTTIANQRVVTVMNEVINTSLTDIVDDLNLTSEDFYNMSADATGRLNSLSVDTILINQVAAQLAVDISSALSHDRPMQVGVPAGLFTGVPILAGLGPNVNINIVPAGEARVEYDTSFTSAGINQINFQVWLYVEANMRIVIPLQETTVPVARRVALVNTIFAGEVPDGMLLTDFGIN